MIAHKRHSISPDGDSLTAPAPSMATHADESTFNRPIVPFVQPVSAITGTPGDDVLTGTSGNDTFDLSQGGNDVASGLGGDDTFIVGNTLTTSDRIDGGAGNDTLLVDGDYSYGQTAQLDFSATTIVSIETLRVAAGSNYYVLIEPTGPGAGQTLAIDASALGATNGIQVQALYALVNNVFSTFAGSVIFTGGAGDDFCHDGAGNGVLAGGAGDDTLNGGEGNDTLIGGAGDDELDGSSFNKALYDHNLGEIDTVDYSASTANLKVDLGVDGFGDASGSDIGHDHLSGINNIIAGGGNDRIVCNYYVNVIDGGAGNDTMTGAASDLGTDTVSFARDTLGVVASLVTGTAAGAGSGHDTFSGFGNLIGGSGNDTLTGDDSNNSIEGGAGNDSLAGGNGNDTLAGDAGNDTIDGGAGTDMADWSSDTLGVAASLLTGTATGAGGNDTLIGIENLTGGSGNDHLTGDGGNNVLDGGTGKDTLAGSSGDDTYLVDSPQDVVVENPGEGIDTVFATSSSYTLGANIERLIFADKGDLNGLAIYNPTFHGVGNASDNLIQGGYGNDTLAGGAGNDTLDGGGGYGFQRDTADFGDDTQGVTVVLHGGYDPNGTADGAGSGHDTLIDINNIIGGSGSDSLTGSEADNIFEGGAGNDTLDGGSGNDTASFVHDSQGVTANLVSGTAIGAGSGHDTLANFENLIGGSGKDALTGDAGDNLLTGNAGDDALSAGDGNDTLVGGAGSDTLDGGTGVDTADYSPNTTGINANLATGLATAGTSTDHLSGIENLTGGIGDDTLTGNGGDNVLVGGAGADSMAGGAGNDTYSVDSALDVVTESPGAGTDTVHTTLTNYTLADNVEILICVGSASFHVTGNALDNSITGGAGDDILVGSLGNDTIDGGAGSPPDTVDYSAATHSVVANLTTGAASGIDIGNDTLTELSNIIGGGGDDILTGSNVENLLVGGVGNDVLAAGAGTDTLDGGDGTDTADYSTDTSGFTASLFSGSAIGGGIGSDRLIGIENLIAGSGDDQLAGNGGDNVLNGGAGIDTVDYSAEIHAVVANLVSGAATGSSIGTDTLISIENARGGSGNDRLTGDSGNNVLNGGAGNDTLDGGSGNDTASFAEDAQGVVANLTTGTAAGAASGHDILTGFENLTGGSGSDALTGNGGDNLLDGGAGDDTLTGGQGNDTYFVDSASDVVVENAGAGLDTVATTLTTLHPRRGSRESLSDAAGLVAKRRERHRQHVRQHHRRTLREFRVAEWPCGNDLLISGAGNDTLDGGDGNDTLEGGGGNDMLTGGAGVDTASYNADTVGFAANLGSGTAKAQASATIR